MVAPPQSSISEKDAIGYAMDEGGGLVPSVVIECEKHYNPSALKQIHVYAKSLKIDYAIVITPDVFLWHKVSNDEIVPMMQGPTFRKYDIRPRLMVDHIQALINMLRNKGLRTDQQMQVLFDIFLLHFYEKESQMGLKEGFIKGIKQAYNYFNETTGKTIVSQDSYHYLDTKSLLDVIDEWAIYKIDGSTVITGYDLVSRHLGKDNTSTPQVLRNFIRDFIKEANRTPEPTIIDIACSYGGLLNTVQESIPGSKATGIDINHRIAQYGSILSIINKGNTRIYNGDALLKSPLDISRNQQGFDIVCCCPPFGIRMNAADADPFVLKTRPRGTADELWVSREVESLKPGGLSVVLVPEGILSKHSAYEMRNSLLRECALEGIIALPPGASKNTGILRSSILIFRRKSKDVQQRKSVFVSELNNIDYRGSKDMDTSEFNEVVADFRFYQEKGY
jgi:type I restriction-modification system DNA methylase subunit